MILIKRYITIFLLIVLCGIWAFSQNEEKPEMIYVPYADTISQELVDYIRSRTKPYILSYHPDMRHLIPEMRCRIQRAKRIGVFSVSKDKQVSFSQGNLQYHRKRYEWRFANNQYDYIGAENIKDGQLADIIDLFGWSGKESKAPFGVSTSTNNADYVGEFVDWGTNIIQGDAANTWRTLSKEEWEYLIKGRKNASNLRAAAQVNGVNGMILLPDDWECPEGIDFKAGYHTSKGGEYYAEYQQFTKEQWRELETTGAIFLPAAGMHDGNGIADIQAGGYYWSATDNGDTYAYTLISQSSGAYLTYDNRYDVRSVRLVHDTIVPPPAPCETFEVNGVKFNMMCVEGAKFLIGQTEVTQGLWNEVMGHNNSFFKGDDLPVEKVSWDECQLFIQKLNDIVGLRFRLPTESEWEFAAKGGNSSRGYTYSGSNYIDCVAWYAGNSEQKTHPVASLRPNELGIYDMSGNVWEWCQDNYTSETQRVVRGGSFFDAVSVCRISNRTGRESDYRSYIGLRLVLDVHEYVDLGLSVMWATTNVGATAPEEYGDYFAWGEVEPKDFYGWSTYKWCNGTDSRLTKYCSYSVYGDNGFVDNKTQLDLEDDAAHVNWGGDWRMPSSAEMQELIDNCRWETATYNGVQGYRITSTISGYTDRSIFLPRAGLYNDDLMNTNKGNAIRYWTSTCRNTNATNLWEGKLTGNTRRCGFSVRPVLPTERAIQTNEPTPSRRIGVFSVGKEKHVSFSQGNLIYLKIKDQWQFADNQLYYTGERHLRNGQIADTVMYFGWSAKDSPTPWGIGLETNVEKYKGEFLDWGVNEIQGDKPNTWRTMSNDEWMYLFTERKNAAQLMGRGKVDDINGVILLPDNWVLPDGLSFAPIDDAVINHYTAEQWAKMESVGAVFIAAAGYFNNRLNPKMRFVGEYAYAASCNTLKDGVLQLYNAFTETTVSYSITGKSSTTLYYAFLRRLVHDTILPPPAPCRTIEVNGVTFNMMCVDGEEYDYFVGQTEVTCSQWKAVMGSLPKGYTVGNKPIHSVTWDECQEFITKLNELTGLYFRFPTKDEWLYAAKGGQYKDDYLYSGSDDINQVGWYSDNSVGTGVHDVAKLKPNSLGIYDMTGNVWEWVESADGKHLYMGGSYAFKAESCLLSKTQGVASNDNHTGSIGIRLVLVINK